MAISSLYLLRHGVTVAPDSLKYPDDDRPLSESGVIALNRQLQSSLNRFAGIEKVYSSPLTRARESAQVLLDVLGRVDNFEILECLTLGGSKTDLIKYLKECAFNSVALVSHEPELCEIVSILCGARRGAVIFKRGTLMQLVFDGDFKEQSGRIDWVVHPSN